MQSMKFLAFTDLVKRYAAVWREVWQIRAHLEHPTRDAEQLAFLPAELELVETPVHPAPRWTMRILVALTVLGLQVGLLGRLDIVVTASGQFIPNARVKTVQPPITGVVREIRVKDGQRVAAGDLLMKLDTTQAAADADKAHMSRLDAELAVARANALLAAQQAARAPVVAKVDDAPDARMQDAQRHAEGTWFEYRDQYKSEKAELAKREAQLASTRAEIAKLVQTAPLARQQADAYHALVADKYVSRNDYLDKEQSALDKEHELAAQRAHASELAAGIAEQRAQVDAAASKFRRNQLDELEKATQAATQNRDDETKATTRQALMSLTAPVAGTVEQLAVHTLGGVVMTAQALMEIVPDDALEVEARLQNKDVGFVQVGQRAAVKIEAFPYTRYGYLDGTIVAVSNDAVQDKKLGLTFPVRIRLTTNRIHIDNRWITLTPGMTVTADIATGKRSVIGYFLDPLMRTAREGMRER
ncbi:Leukotoxin export protein LtxD [Paraburkholderia hiiakae]|uniref:Membrane fusion protein (MFP) family protein n=1 Tax=Paraburkholderia hiiakae TaxID=1081782 RepID=A0ABM8NEB3_9BURK|nr:HlyD family type I secretion periplasmic adaptor subunit [Paraburkholderia hiiakae]CAD6520044.1 Leukotoxin export protein LtxD [Paraburkholderia hiiakae]